MGCKLFLGILCLIKLAHCEVPEALQDLQTEFYLPYSVTEDVDFSISRPGGYGCYQWSSTNEDVVALDPVHSDYENLCGTRLEFRIIKNNGHPNVDFKIVAENVEQNDDGKTEIPNKIEYTIHVREVGKLEVLGLKTELTAGSDAVPFGVAGYDKDENEFDTLDGLQISWYIGGKREVAIFENFRQVGPIIKVIPVGFGQGAVIAVLSDPNYEKIEPSFMEFNVKADLSIEPDGAYLLEGGVAHLQLFEKSGMKDEEGNFIKRELQTTGEDPDFTFDVKETEYVTYDKASGNITAQKVGETTIFVKNSQGDIVKGMPIRVTKAASITVTAEPHPESKQLILDHDYVIRINIFNKEGRPVYPSDNILCKITYPKQFKLNYVSESGLYAEVTTASIGLGKVKANLRSVLTADDEEIEIVPHIKGSLDFEVYEQVIISPTMTILPWDDNVKPEYHLTYKSKGGGQVYAYSVDNPEAATTNNDGKVDTTASGSVSFKVRSYMPQSEGNYDEAEVHILPATHLELLSNSIEFSTRGYYRGNVAFSTLLPETNEKVVFSDCATIPYEVKLSNEEDFVVEDYSKLGATQSSTHCAHFNVRALRPASTKISVSYLEPSSGRTLRSHSTVTSYDPLEVLYPTKDANTNHMDLPRILLPIGSSSKLIMKGGPTPWASKPSAHMKQIETSNNTVAKITHQGPTLHEDGSYKEEHVYDVTCLQEGETEVAFIIGNSRSETQEETAQEERKLVVKCAMPSKLTFKYASEDGSKLAHSPKHNRVLANKNKDLKLTYTLKDKSGATFSSVDSLNIEAKVDDDSVLKPETQYASVPEVEFTKLAKVPGKATHILKAKGKEGPVDLKVKLAGYNQAVLDKHGIKDAPALPKVIDFDEDVDYEDEEEFMDHGHSLMDELELHLTSQDEMNKIV